MVSQSRAPTLLCTWWLLYRLNRQSYNLAVYQN